MNPLIAKQLIALLKEEQTQRAEARLAYEKREAQQHAALTELQQLENQREQAQTREDKLKQQIKQQRQAIQASTAPSIPLSDE
jgi:hypothetical protein